MKLMRFLTSAFITLTFVLGSAFPSRGGEEDTKALRQQMTSEGHILFEDKMWEDLERIAGELRGTKARFPDGCWKLSSFYEGLNPEKYAKKEEEWNAWFTSLDEWKRARPDSITQSVARAEALTSYAWKARGMGWGSSVTDQGAKLMEERLAEARRVLEEGRKLAGKCPQWFSAMQHVALGQGWDRAEYEALYQQAVKFEPEYYNYYFAKAYFLLPRWYGQEGEWERFAEEAAQKDDPAEGMTVYTRIAWSTASLFTNLFKETRIEWPKMKQGFLDMEKACPDSRWNLNNFFKFATMAGDRATAGALLKRIGDTPDLKAWNTGGEFERARLWTTGELNQTKPRAILNAKKGESICLRFSPDGQQLAAGYARGAVIAWDVAGHQPAWELDELDERVSSVAFSPDGKLFAAAVGDFDATVKGVVKIWDAPTQIAPMTPKPRATIEDWSGSVFALAFTPDGKKLAMTGGPYNKKGEARLWEVASGATEPLAWAPEHTHALTAVAISPDSHVLVTDCNRSITVWDLVEGKSLYDTQQDLQSWVQAVAFSPDGKLVAAALSPGWDRRQDPGGVALWDAPGYTKRLPGLETKTCGLWSVSFSPDSRLLAGGGFDGCVRVWEISSGREIGTFYGHEGTIFAVAFSPDGKTIASAGHDGTVRLWDAPQASPVRPAPR